MNKFLKSLLRTAVSMMDQYYELVDRASDRVSDMVDRGREVIYPENHELRNILSFVAGVGVGIGAGVLLAPASGKEIRSSIREKVRNIRGQAS
ncbi:MAG TPA: YtxH domain-containing protein [Candidatus Sulfotelmatobacter sp.]|nr:YtxH domain-containing protein [Candidatus Sulfotelmatobacter sp.]